MAKMEITVASRNFGVTESETRLTSSIRYRLDIYANAGDTLNYTLSGLDYTNAILIDDGVESVYADGNHTYGNTAAIEFELNDYTGTPLTTTAIIYTAALTPTEHLYYTNTFTNYNDEVATGLQNVVEDLTPQLGGALDLNGKLVHDTAQTATGTGATTINWNNGGFFHFQFGAFNETFTFTAPTAGEPTTLILKLVQDSVGSRTVTWPASVKWPSGIAPTLTITPTTGTDIITFYYDGTNYNGTATLDIR